MSSKPPHLPLPIVRAIFKGETIWGSSEMTVLQQKSNVRGIPLESKATQWWLSQSNGYVQNTASTSNQTEALRQGQIWNENSPS